MVRPRTRAARLPLLVAPLLALSLARPLPLPAEEGPPAAPAPQPGPGAPAYGGTPPGLVPFAGEGEPARRFFAEPPAFRGPADAGQTVGPVRVGVIAPAGGPDGAAGRALLAGLTLALEEANAAGGAGPGRPFELVVRDENDTWGAAGNALVDLMRGPGVVAVVGAFEDAQSHVMTRLLLKLEVPMINTAGPDPTLTEHAIPWLVRVRPDDRQAGYRLARRLFQEERRERVVVFRSNDRYGRTGVRELVDAARRLGHPVLLEQRFEAVEGDLSRQVGALRALRPDAVVLWGRPEPTARALKALRLLGVDAPVYGPDRLADPAFLAPAGAAAAGATLAVAFDPARGDPAFTAFAGRDAARFQRPPEALAAYAYDGFALLAQAVRQAGTSRTAVREALFRVRTMAGVSGPIVFDVTQNNVTPMRLVRVRRGALVPDEP